MEPGVTLFSVYRREGDDRGNDYGLLVAVDAAGDVVWYYRSDERITDARRLGNGNLLHNGGAKRDRMYEIDMLGFVVRQWHAAGVGGEAPAGSIPFPLRDSASLTLGLPPHTADLIAVTVFRMVKIRPGSAPSVLRGLWCP